MSEELKAAAELRAMEEKLAGFAPAAPAIDRDGLMYRAGRAAAEQGRTRRWQGACAVLLLALMGSLFIHPGRQGVQERVARSIPQQTPVVGRPERAPEIYVPFVTWAGGGGLKPSQGNAYMQLRQQLITGGAVTDAPAAWHPAVPGFTATLRSGEGLDALPEWQRRAVLPHVGGEPL